MESVFFNVCLILYVNILDVHHPSFLKTQYYRDWICLRPQVNKRRGGVLLWWVP
jgi:hypothetical protein